ncbi:hypothetical protein U14_05917 [Candidatus Moduliflexus flocculans]|uniref:Lipoprotein n=1 Tax=Candidatus Moduliflexus flocculans TaxID=1499966 RepID=A0A081BT99_9BACT|nr:hypothetical protein U14_05917 [Candidatus Moduliflexus flocculans]
MNTFRKAVLLSWLILMVIACDNSNSYSEEKTSIEQLDENTFLFVVEQKIEKSIIDGNSIDDSLYVEVENGETYTISFSDAHKHVSITPGELSGSLESEENDILQYRIDEGYFAGGRFEVRIENNLLYGVLTEYGSGVWIVASEKGHLSQVPKK